MKRSPEEYRRAKEAMNRRFAQLNGDVNDTTPTGGRTSGGSVWRDIKTGVKHSPNHNADRCKLRQCMDCGKIRNRSPGNCGFCGATLRVFYRREGAA